MLEKKAEGGARLREVPGLRELLERVEGGDEGARRKLKSLLEEVPVLARKLVDPAKIAERSMVETYAGAAGTAVKEALPAVLEQMRGELAGDDPSPLERLLVERVVATWLQVHYFEALYSQNASGMSFAQADHHQKRVDRAHRRHLSAIKTLAQVRKMGPAVQINIADKQINTAG